MKGVLIAMLLVGCCPLYTSSFTLLAHEAMIDASWEKYIKPLLKYRFPDATEEELKKARAFAYGGAVIPDIGYYPLGSLEFSNFVHYIRSGDFVIALLTESANIQEYAFALGVLCHHEVDNFGHALGTNKAVPLLFSYNENDKTVTFEQDRNGHLRAELSFDVFQAARGNYSANTYHDFMGFEASEAVLSRAFLKTYGLPLKDVFKNLPGAVSNLRYSLRLIISELTKKAWKFKSTSIVKSNPQATKSSFHYQISKRNYKNDFGHPKVQSVFIAIIIGVLPKYRPRFRFDSDINREVEELYAKSFNASLAHYSSMLNSLYSIDCVNKNINLDTGKETVRNEYVLADNTYFQLLMRLEKNEFAYTSRKLKKNLIDYYYVRGSAAVKIQPRKDNKVAHAMAQLTSITSIRRPTVD